MPAFFFYFYVMKKAWYWFYFLTTALYTIVALPMEMHVAFSEGHRNFFGGIDFTDNGRNVLFFIYFFGHLLFFDKLLFGVFIVMVVADLKRRKHSYDLNIVSLILVALAESNFAFDFIRLMLLTPNARRTVGLTALFYAGAAFLEVAIAIVVIIAMVIAITKREKAGAHMGYTQRR